jgi:hypothetical protein
MKYENKAQLRDSIFRFLRQRRAYYKQQQWEDRHRLCDKLIETFELIESYGYWRQCLEVRNQHPIILYLLPSASGGHKQIRANMLQLIRHCITVADIPYAEYTLHHDLTTA